MNKGQPRDIVFRFAASARRDLANTNRLLGQRPRRIGRRRTGTLAQSQYAAAAKACVVLDERHQLRNTRYRQG